MDGGEIELNYQEGLPICEHREEILALPEKNDVVIVCGDTGSGKTTQLPKMAMELGRRKNGRRIACIQPRRLAAVTVAERVADELKSPVGARGNTATTRLSRTRETLQPAARCLRTRKAQQSGIHELRNNFREGVVM